MSDEHVKALVSYRLEQADDARIERAIRDLEHLGEHRLMEANHAATGLLLKGTMAEGRPDWDHGRPQSIRFIDFDRPENNDFLVVNQFKVELAGGRGHVIPDAVLLVNGIPLVVAEFKSPGIESALADAINQLLRYSNQRKELYPTQFTDDEGVERLFHWNQLLVASNFFEARAATIGAPPEAYLEWADTSPVPLSTVAEELGLIPRDLEAEAQAAEELRIIGSERGDRREFPGLDPRGQVPFVRLLLEELEKDRELTGDHRAGAIGAGLEMVERIRQEIRKVGFWRNPHAREVLTKALVRDLDDCGLCLPGKERDLAQRLVALAKENHENLTK